MFVYILCFFAFVLCYVSHHSVVINSPLARIRKINYLYLLRIKALDKETFSFSKYEIYLDIQPVTVSSNNNTLRSDPTQEIIITASVQGYYSPY